MRGWGVGANMRKNLAPSGFGKLVVIDCDRIEERDISTQSYYKTDFGAYKVKILTNSLYRELRRTVEGRSKELTVANAPQLLRDAGIVIDTFDNSMARQAVKDYCNNA